MALSTYNMTFVRPTLSVAGIVTDTVIVPETVAPLAGEVTEMAGGVVSNEEPVVVKVKSADVAK